MKRWPDGEVPGAPIAEPADAQARSAPEVPRRSSIDPYGQLPAPLSRLQPMSTPPKAGPVFTENPNAPRFEDCGDGTLADHQTGLQWEKKTGTLTGGVTCETVGCPDPHDVNNRYQWSNTGTAPDGDAFTDFLAKLNDQTFGAANSGDIYADPSVTGCFAGHCDWRLSKFDELGTILVGPEAAPGQA